MRDLFKRNLFILLFLAFLSPAGFPEAAQEQEKTYKDTYTVKHLTKRLHLFDSKIDLTREDIRERFEREFFQFLEKKGLLHVITKRYLKYRKLVEEAIRKSGVHPDFMYLVTAESYLNPRAVSKSEATGLWQFIKETGKAEGLIINEVIDERYDIVKSTYTALSHIRKLFEEFGDWFLASAAYNAGAKRIRDAIENQGTTDFFDLYLPEETERYVFRILALKEIIENRERYGIKFDDTEKYRELSVDYINIKTERELHTLILARSMGLSYREFRYLNLHMKKYVLPKGTYNLYFPSEKKSSLIEKLKLYPFVTVQGR